MRKEIVDVVKVKEARDHFHNPVWLNQDDSDDVEHADFLAQERFVLDPRNDVVQGPACVEKDASSS